MNRAASRKQFPISNDHELNRMKHPLSAPVPFALARHAALLRLLLFSALALPGGPVRAADAPSLRPAPTLLLAIDDVSLPLRKNVCLYLSKPTVRAAPVLAPSAIGSNAPDNLATHFYGTVLHDPAPTGPDGKTGPGKFRMWYYAVHRGRNPDWPPRKMQQIAKPPGWQIGVQAGHEVSQGPLCYAESDDGLAWTKPALGQVLFKGSRANNALDLPHTVVSGAAVIRDDADPDPARRYKMVYQFFPDQTAPPIKEYGSSPSVACAVSPDGVRWTMTGMPFVNQFVEHCSLIRHGGKYIVHSQVFPGAGWSGAYTEGGGKGGRSGVAHATYDFDHWPDLWQWAFTLPEPASAAQRGPDQRYDQVHLGVGAVSLGNVCVGVYGLWHNQAFGAEFGKISCDLGLVVSNDGIRFREPTATAGYPFIRREDSLVTPAAGKPNLPTILCQGNGILNVGDETRIYHGRWRNAGQRAEDIAAHYYAEVALATLPRDRWGALALHPGANEGAVGSDVIELLAGGGEILLNADAARGLRVELLDEQFKPLPGFSGPGSGTTAADGGLDCLVKWPQGEVSSLSGKKVRLLVHLKKTGDTPPRLYAISIRAKGGRR